MKIHLIRHCDTTEWEKWIILDSLDWELSKKWKKIYEKIIRNNYKKISIEKIFTSKQKRAIESAKIWKNFFWKNILIEENFLLNERKSWIAEWKNENEINWGEYEKLPITKRKHYWWENFEEVFIRAEKFYNFLKTKSYNEILIVGHSVWILMFLAYTKRITIEEILKNKNNYSGFISIEI